MAAPPPPRRVSGRWVVLALAALFLAASVTCVLWTRSRIVEPTPAPPRAPAAPLP